MGGDGEALIRKETAQSTALTRAETHLGLAQAPGGSSLRGPRLGAPGDGVEV